MDEPFTQYQVTVTYVTSGEPKTYIGWFPGRTAREGIDAGRAFVTKYMRPQFISEANEVVSLSGI